MNFKMKILKRMISVLCAVSVVASSGVMSVGAIKIVGEQAKVGNFEGQLSDVNNNIATIKSNFEQIKKKNIGGNYDKLIEDVLKAIVDLDKLEVKEIDVNFNNLSDNIFLLSLESGSWVEKQQIDFKEEPKEFENFKNDCEEFIKSVHLLTDYNMKKDDKENNDDGEFHQNHSNSMCELQNKLKLSFDEETSEENNSIDQSISFEYSDDGFQSIESISPFGSVISYNNSYSNNDNIKYLREKMEQLELKIKGNQSGLLDELNGFVQNALWRIEALKLIEVGSNDSEFKTVEEDSILLSFAVEDLIEEIESGKGASKESVEIFKENCDNFTADALIFKNNNVITDNDDNQSFVSFSDEGKFENNENNENNKNMNTRTSNVYALLNPSVDVDSNVIKNIFGSFGEHIQSENINNNNNANSALEISNVLNEDNNNHEQSNILENNGSNSNVANKKVDKNAPEKLIKKRNNVQNKKANKKSTKKASNVANKKVDKELTKKINNSMSKNFNMNNVAIRPFRKINMGYNNVYKVSGVSKQSINSIFGNVNEGMSNEKFKKSGEDITRTFVRAAIEGRSFEDYLRINFGRLNSAQKQLYEIATAAYNKGQIIKHSKQ